MPACSAERPLRRRGLARMRTLGVSAALLVAIAMLAEWRDHHALLINRTDSLPNWAFFVTIGRRPMRGDYVAFVPPGHPLVRRHFGEKREPWGKMVYGMPGDRVGHHGAYVTINGRAVGRIKPLTRFGERLTPAVAGRIPNGCLYAGTPHPNGFDSRYAEIGLVCERQIIGTGVAIL